MVDEPVKFASRGGEKLAAALDTFGVDVAGRVCADFGCNVGGFTDCLLQRGAAKVYAVDTGYGELAWKLRKDSRVVVMERTNALHCDPPEPVDIVVIDAAWTPQERIVPAAIKWLKTDENARPRGVVVSLLKPHYEITKLDRHRPEKQLEPEQVSRVCREVCSRLENPNYRIQATMRSILRGKGGNEEFFLLIGAGQADGT